jgi:hypothetical protein
MPEATPEFKQWLREAFDEMYVGQTFAFQRTFTEGDVALFCGVTGDYNPYHQDESFAAESWYGKLTIPGLLTGSMLTHIGGMLGFLATEMPFEYLAPVFAGDTSHAPLPWPRRTRRSVESWRVPASSIRMVRRCSGRGSPDFPPGSASSAKRGSGRPLPRQGCLAKVQTLG